MDCHIQEELIEETLSTDDAERNVGEISEIDCDLEQIDVVPEEEEWCNTLETALSEVKEKNESHSVFDEDHFSIQYVKIDKKLETQEAEEREDEVLIDQDSIPSFQNTGTMKCGSSIRETSAISHIDELNHLENEELNGDETQIITDDHKAISFHRNDDGGELKDEPNASLMEHEVHQTGAEILKNCDGTILPNEKDCHGNDGFYFMLEEDDKMLDYDEPSQLDDRDDTNSVGYVNELATVGNAEHREAVDNEKDRDASIAKTGSSSESSHKFSKDFNLWVSGLSSSTKAQDLKNLFSNYTKVLSSKIVSSSKIPGGKYFGLITVASEDGISDCITNLNGIEVDDQIIQVERFKGSSSKRSKPISQNAASSAKETDVDGTQDIKEGISGSELDRAITPVKIPSVSFSPRDDSMDRSDTHSQSGEDNFGIDSSSRVSIKDRLGKRTSSTGDLTKKILVAGNILATKVGNKMNLAEKFDFSIDAVSWPYSDLSEILKNLTPLIKTHHEFIILFGLTFEAWTFVPLFPNDEPKLCVKNTDFNLDSIALKMKNFILHCKEINPNMRVVLILPTVQDMFTANCQYVRRKSKKSKKFKDVFEMARDSRIIHRQLQSLKNPKFEWPDKIVFSLQDVLDTLGHGKSNSNKDVENFLSGRSKELCCYKSLICGYLPTRFLISKFWAHFVPFYHSLLREGGSGKSSLADSQRKEVKSNLSRISPSRVRQARAAKSIPERSSRNRLVRIERSRKDNFRPRERVSIRSRLEDVSSRAMERRHIEESYKIKRERELLRIEREKIELEKEKLLRLELERERENLMREKEKLRKERMKYEEFHGGMKRSRSPNLSYLLDDYDRMSSRRRLTPPRDYGSRSSYHHRSSSHRSSSPRSSFGSFDSNFGMGNFSASGSGLWVPPTNSMVNDKGSLWNSR